MNWLERELARVRRGMAWRSHWWDCFATAIVLWDHDCVQRIVMNASGGSPEASLVWC